MLAGILSGCAGSTSAIFDSLRFAVKRDSTIAQTQLNPNLRYLRATIAGRTALLVLGYVEDHPQGPIQVWYSAEREVLRIQNGRIVGAVGLTTEWRNVTVMPSPQWSSIAHAGEPSRLIRIRDVMPGYRYGVKESLLLKQAPPPTRSALQVLDPQTLTWFEESVESDPSGPTVPKERVLPMARYAVIVSDGNETVVYGEQCLSIEFCFAWQRWPADAQNVQRNQ